MKFVKNDSMDREIELIPIPIGLGDDYHYVYYHLKSPNLIERLFSKKGFLWRSYKHLGGGTYMFDIDEYEKVVDKLKTYRDIENWRKEQMEKSFNAKTQLKKRWRRYK